MPSYHDAVEELYKLGYELHRVPADKFNLEDMRVLLEALGNPERRFTSVLIAGTNGKGSTAATLASILRAAGYHTGLYTSPHLVRINERIQVNSNAIADTLFAEVYAKVRISADVLVAEKKLPGPPSFFEMVTAMAFLHFARAGVQIAVVEVGLGGRLDATNVLEPAVSVITDIALDHQKYLGDTLTQIAGEKAGIMRRDTPVVLLPQHPEVNDALGRAIESVGARPVNASEKMPPVSPNAEALVQAAGGRTRYQVSVMGAEIEVDSPLAGLHQMRNLALAITTAEVLSERGFPITPDQVERGIRETNWPGRFQVIPADAESGHPEIVLDVAHNPAGAWTLRSTLSAHFPDRRFVFVFGAMRDKDISEIAQILFPIAEVIVATRAVENPRSAETREIREVGQRTGAEIVEVEPITAALEKAFELALERNALVVVTGSVYVVGEAVRELVIG